jgi:hypothetical protein
MLDGCRDVYGGGAQVKEVCVREGGVMQVAGGGGEVDRVLQTAGGVRGRFKDRYATRCTHKR